MKKMFSSVLAASLFFSAVSPSFAQAKAYERLRNDQLRNLSHFVKNPLDLVVQHFAEKLVKNPKEFHLFYEQYIHELQTISKKEKELKVPFESLRNRLLFAMPIFNPRDEKIYVLSAIRGKSFQTNLVLIFSKDGKYEGKAEKDFEIKKLLIENEFKVNENWELKDIRTGSSLWPNFLVVPNLEGQRLKFTTNKIKSHLLKKKSFQPWVKAASILLVLNFTTLLTQGCVQVTAEQSSMIAASFPFMNLYFTVIALVLLNLYSLITKHQNYFPAFVFYPYFSIKKVQLPDWLFLSNLISSDGNTKGEKPTQLNESRVSDGGSELEAIQQTKINIKHITDGTNKVRLMDVTGVERLGVMGDVQGNYLQMVNALEKSGFIDSNGAWIAGSSVLIFDGDLIDGGPNPWEVLRFVYNLQNKASAKGGKVIAVMGNHEYMFINSIEGRDQYARELIWTHWLSDDSDMTGLNTLKKLLGREFLVPDKKDDPYADLGYAVQNREDLLKEIYERYPEFDNILRWMKHSMPYAVRVNGNILVAHAAPDLYAKTFEEISTSARGELMTIQDRYWVNNLTRVKEWMKSLGIEYFVYGHTCQTPIGVGENRGLQGKVSQITSKIYNINTIPRHSAEGGALGVLEFLFDRDLAHTVKVTYGENEFGLEDKIFEHYSDKVYSAFMAAAEKAGVKRLEDFIAGTIKYPNMVRSSSTGQVYKIEGVDDYEVLFPRNIKFDEFKLLQDPFPNSNFGQAVAQLGTVTIHKRLSGVPYSVSSMSFDSGPTLNSLYERHLEIAAQIPQSAYDQLAIDLKKIQDAGYTFDLTDSNSIFIDQEHSRFQPHNFISKKDVSLPHVARMAALLLNHEFSAEKYDGKDPRIFYWRRLILEKCLIAAERLGLEISNEIYWNNSLFNPDSEMELAFELALLKGEWPKAQSRMMKNISVQKIFSDYPFPLPKKARFTSKQRAQLRGFEEFFYSTILVSGIGEIWNHLFFGAPLVGYLIGSMISLLIFMKSHKKPIYLTSEGVLTHAPPLEITEAKALSRAKKILFLVAITLRTIYLLTLYLSPFGNITDLIIATIAAMLVHGVIYNSKLAPRYYWPLAMTSNKADDQLEDDDPNIKILNKYHWNLSKARRELGIKVAGRGGGYFRFFKEKGLLPQMKKKIIERLIEYNGNYIKTAQSFGINELTLRNFRKDLKIKTPKKKINSVNKDRSGDHPVLFESSMISDDELLDRLSTLKFTAKKKIQFIQGLNAFANMVLSDMREKCVNPEEFIKEAEKYALVRMEVISKINRQDRLFFAQYTDNKELEFIFKAMSIAETFLGEDYKNYFVGIVKDYFENGSSFILGNSSRLDLWIKQNDAWNQNPFHSPIAYLPKEEETKDWFEQITGFPLESFHDSNGVLSIPYVYHAMLVRKSVNPEHKPLVAVYGGAGADISTFLLSTDASTGYFVTKNQVNEEQLKSMMEQWDSITFDDDYAKDKRLYGFGNGRDLDKKKNAIHKAIVQELKAIGVTKESVRIENEDGHTKIIFDWVYPGANRSRTYSIIYISESLEKIGTLKTTDPLLNSVLEKGIDIYYQKAGQGLNKLWGQFLPRIAHSIKIGGASITDDYESIGIHNPEPFFNADPYHFVFLKQPSSQTLFDWWRKIIPSRSTYGWGVTIRIKKEKHHPSPALIFPESNRAKQDDWAKKLQSEEYRNSINPAELAPSDLLDYLDAKSFFAEYWWWAHYQNVSANPQVSEDDLILAFNSYLTELEEVDKLIKNDFNEKELEDFQLFILLNQVEILKSRIELRWKEFGLAHIDRVIHKKTGRTFPIDVTISNLNELNPYKDSSEPSSILEELNSLFTKDKDFSHLVERSLISYFGPIALLEKRLRAELKQRINSDPALINKLVRLSFKQSFVMSDLIMDWMLNLNSEWIETTANHQDIKDRLGVEQYGYEGTPYHKIKEILLALPLSSSDVFYDLGSGYGRLPIYAAMTTQAGKIKGIEIFPERVAESNRVKDQLGLENVEFIQGNIREHDFSDGTIFYLFNPFNDETLEIVVNKLKEVAQKKKIRIVSWGSCTNYFGQQDWLKPIATVGSSPWPMILYESNIHGADLDINAVDSEILSKKIIKDILHLETFLDDPDIDVRRTANDAAQRIQAAFLREEDFVESSSKLNDGGLKDMEQSLKSRDEDARSRAIIRLKKHYLAMIGEGEKPNLDMLEERLSDPDFSVRRTAAISLGSLYYALKMDLSQLEKYLDDTEYYLLIGVIALGETLASYAREGKVVEEDYEKYRLWKANNLPYEEDLVADYLEQDEPKIFIDALKRKAEKIIREGFNYIHSQNLWLAFLGIRFNGIHISWKDFNERMEDVIEFDQDHPGSFRALFSKPQGSKVIEISDKESKQINVSGVNTKNLDEHFYELLKIKEQIDSLNWLNDFEGDKDFSLRNLYFVFKRQQALDRKELNAGERFRVTAPSEDEMMLELRADLKLLYKIAFQLVYKKIGNKTLKEKRVHLMRDLIMSEALLNSDLVREMMSPDIETRVIAIKNFYEDSIHHLPNEAVGVSVRQIKPLQNKIQELTKQIYAEIEKVTFVKTNNSETYRLIPQGFLSLFRGRAGINDCSYDRERGFPHTRAMHEDTLYYFVYKGKALKGYVGLMMGVREDGKKVLTIDTINSPSFAEENILLNLFQELNKVAKELGAIGIALPQDIENTQYFNFDNKNVIPKMGVVQNGKKIKVQPLHKESWTFFTEKFGEDRYNSMEAGNFILLDLTASPQTEQTASEHLVLSEDMTFLSTYENFKGGVIPTIENWWMKHFPKTPKAVYRLLIATLITEGSWLNLAPVLAGEILLHVGFGIVPTGIAIFILNLIVGARFITLHPAGSKATPIFIVAMNSIAILFFYPLVQWHPKEIVLFNAYLGGTLTHILLNAFQMFIEWISEDKYKNELSTELEYHKRDIAIARARYRKEPGKSREIKEPNKIQEPIQPEMVSQFLSRYPQMEKAYGRSAIERHWYAFQSLHLDAGEYADSIFFVVLPALSAWVTKKNIQELGDYLISLGERAGEDYETVYYMLAALKEIITLKNLEFIAEEILFLNKAATGNAGPILSFALYTLREMITPDNLGEIGALLIALHRLGPKNSRAYFWLSFFGLSRFITPKNLRSVCLDLFHLDKTAGHDARILFETGFLAIRNILTAEHLITIGLDLILLLRTAKQYKRFLFHDIIPELKAKYGERWTNSNWEEIKNRLLKTLEDIHNGVLDPTIFKKNSHEFIQKNNINKKPVEMDFDDKEDVLTYRRNQPADITDSMVRQLLKNKIESSEYRTRVFENFFVSPQCEYFDALQTEDMWKSLGAWKFLREIYRRFGSLKGRTVIDLYAGPGVSVEQLIRLGSVNAFGIETDPRFVEFAKGFGIPIIHGTLLKEDIKTVMRESIGEKRVDLTFSYGLLNNISNRKKRLKVLRSITSLTPAGSFSVHGTEKRIPYSNEEFKKAGFRVIEVNKERTFIVLYKESEPGDWDKIVFDPLLDEKEEPGDDKEIKNSSGDRTVESTVNSILNTTISVLPIFFEPISSSSFASGQNSWNRLTLDTQKALIRSFPMEPSFNVSISQWVGGALAIEAGINKNPLAVHLFNEKISFASALLQWNQLDSGQIIGNTFTLFRKPNWVLMKGPNIIFKMGGTVFSKNSSVSDIQNSIERMARNLNEKAPDTLNQKDSIKITVSYREFEKFATTIQQLTKLFEEKRIELLVVTENSSIKDQEIKGQLIQKGIENLKFRVLTQPKNNGKFDFQELIDAYGLFNTSLILLSQENEWNLENVLQEIIRIETEPLTHILNIGIEKIKLIATSA